MRRLLGFLASLGLGLVMAGVGLILDAQSLIYSGLPIFVLVAALWLYTWARPIEVLVPVPVAAIAPPPGQDDPKGQALWALGKARADAALAMKQRQADAARQAYHDTEAALLSVEREFGFGPLRLVGRGQIDYKDLLKALVIYVDRFLPLLREGHVKQARTRATAFSCVWSIEGSEIARFQT